MLKLKNVYLSYNKDYFTLFNINLSLQDGEGAILFGEKDSGKSSLIRLIIGLENCTKGEAEIKGINVDKIDFKNDVNLGYIPSEGAYLEKQSVEKNLEYVLKIRKTPKTSIQVKITNALTSFGLNMIKDIRLKDLSSYERIRVSLARLSLRNLDFLVVDDIFEKISGKECDEIIKMIKDLIETNKCTVLIATNNKAIIKEFKYRVIELKNGAIISEE